MKLLSKSGGSGTCNICHLDFLVFLNDSRKMRQTGAFMTQRKFDFFFSEKWVVG